MENKKLCETWLKLKNVEEKAKKQRHEIEHIIEENLGKIDGQSRTIHDGDFIVKVKKSETWSFSPEWEEIRHKIPAELRPEKIIYELDKKGYEFLKENNHEIYLVIEPVVSYKTGKTGISVEREGE